MNTNIKKILGISSLSIFFILIIIYAFFRSSDLIFGVRIKNVIITSPEALLMINSTSKASGVRKITGNAKNAVELSLNDRKISVDQHGNFNETVALLSGYNIIKIEAKDKFGYSDEKNYQLIYEDAAL